MALPVIATPDGPMTPLATTYLEEPILGVVESYDPTWVADVMRVAVVAVAPLVLAWAASTSMLGLSRHTYSLATNRQIPSWLGKLNKRWTTPHVAILVAAVISFGLVIPGDVLFLGGLYAFGATIAFAIAHVSLVRLRFTQPDRERPFRVPLNVPLARGGGAAAGGGGRCTDDLRLDHGAALSRRGPVHRRRLDAVRAGRVRRLPRGGRGHVADQARDRSGQRAGQRRAGARVRRDPGAGFRDAAGRRHRQHGRPACGCGRTTPAGNGRTSRSSSWSRSRSPSRSTRLRPRSA